MPSITGVPGSVYASDKKNSDCTKEPDAELLVILPGSVRPLPDSGCSSEPTRQLASVSAGCALDSSANGWSNTVELWLADFADTADRGRVGASTSGVVLSLL
ncbi:MAG: hypothetical protein EOO65_03135 [Methanosarcinales archaeon]|nr:MAG: hypothetical protein EOO65_03135 [Methanosarcinales archaeon]